MDYKFGRYPSTATQFLQVGGLSFTLNQLKHWIAGKTQTATLVVLLFGGGVWATTSAIAPQTAQAYTARASLTLNRQPNETYETLMRRAETNARAAAQRSFDQDILVTDVAVTIVAQNQGKLHRFYRCK